MRNIEQVAPAGFRITGEPIHGGSSVVYRAEHADSMQEVALKILHAEREPERLRREIRSLQRLQHPAIVSVVESGEFNGVPFLATPWIEGESLSFRLRREGSLSVSEALRLCTELADALDHAHALGVVHGDLSPSNVLLDRQGHARLIDFGVARQSGDITVTAHDKLAGTPRYLAPELLRGAPPSSSSDQYALGVVLYEMLAGFGPFGSDAKTAATLLHDHLNTLPEPLIEHLPDLSVAVDRTVLKALEKKPELRFSDVAAFSQGLTESSTGTEPSFVSPDRSAPRRPSMWLGGAVAGVVLTLGFTALALAPTTSVVGEVLAAGANDCNLMPNPLFNEPLTDNFYRDADNARLADQVEHAAISTSPVLSLGDYGVYGLYGKIIEIDPAHRYQLSAELYPDDYVHDFRLSVDWLDQQWQVIPGTEVHQRWSPPLRERAVFTNIKPPAGAVYAVPTVYKDASEGSLHIDNMIFSVLGTACSERES